MHDLKKKEVGGKKNPEILVHRAWVTVTRLEVRGWHILNKKTLVPIFFKALSDAN